MKVTVMTPARIKISVEGVQRVRDVKAQLLEKTGIPARQQLIYFRGRLLKSSRRPLTTYQVKAGSTLYLVKKLLVCRCLSCRNSRYIEQEELNEERQLLSSLTPEALQTPQDESGVTIVSVGDPRQDQELQSGTVDSPMPGEVAGEAEDTAYVAREVVQAEEDEAYNVDEQEEEEEEEAMEAEVEEEEADATENVEEEEQETETADNVEDEDEEADVEDTDAVDLEELGEDLADDEDLVDTHRGTRDGIDEHEEVGVAKDQREMVESSVAEEDNEDAEELEDEAEDEAEEEAEEEVEEIEIEEEEEEMEGTEEEGDVQLEEELAVEAEDDDDMLYQLASPAESSGGPVEQRLSARRRDIDDDNVEDGEDEGASVVFPRQASFEEDGANSVGESPDTTELEDEEPPELADPDPDPGPVDTAALLIGMTTPSPEPEPEPEPGWVGHQLGDYLLGASTAADRLVELRPEDEDPGYMSGDELDDL